MENYESWSLVFAGLSALGTLIAGFGAIFAIFQIGKHWRDDDLHVTVLQDHESFKADRFGRPSWCAFVTIVNSGKTMFSVDKFTFADRIANEFFDVRKFPRTDYPLDQGAFVKGWAVVNTKQDGVFFPELLEIKIMSADRKVLGEVFIKNAHARSAVYDDTGKLP